MARSAPRIELSLGRSRLAAAWMLAVHVPAIMALMLLPAWLGGLLLVPLAWQARRFWRRHVSRQGREAVVSLRSQDDGWVLRLADGSEVTSALRGAPWVSPALVALVFAGHRVLLFADAGDPGALRRLRVALRSGVAEGAESSAAPAGRSAGDPG